MAKVAIVVLAGAATHEGLGRVVNALEAAKELKEGDEHEDHPSVRRLVHDGDQVITS